MTKEQIGKIAKFQKEQMDFIQESIRKTFAKKYKHNSCPTDFNEEEKDGEPDIDAIEEEMAEYGFETERNLQEWAEDHGATLQEDGSWSV